MSDASMPDVIEVNLTNFQRDVIDVSRRVPVLVDFWAPWCQPCRALTPKLEALAASFAGRMRLAKINSDDNPELARRFGVRGIPNVKAFVGGVVVDEFTGVLPERELHDFMEALLPSPAQPACDEMQAALARGDAEAALAMGDVALALDAGFEPARLGRVEALIALGRLDEAQDALDKLPEPRHDAARIGTLYARLAVARRQPAGNAQDYEARIARNPGDLAARLAWSAALAARQDWEGAMAQALEVVRQDRAFEDDAGRRALLDLFALLGSDHELVRRFRRELAALLNR
ncbi:tetratricopeptide repeat protein [Methyloversatilis thermotolerans]|uniref:tetratricopeptide repeat protein n=1 Tax=Methyloversatilis thermotolerans TaxID=1346290 RepID=UPI00037DDA10|nr:tetratricopeptide repeat protein [Methyloversatilis thermotolerans]